MENQIIHRVELTISRLGLYSIIRASTISYSALTLLLSIAYLANYVFGIVVPVCLAWIFISVLLLYIDFYPTFSREETGIKTEESGVPAASVRPAFVLEYASFLVTYSGRGLIHIIIGGTIAPPVVFREPYLTFPIIFGIYGMATGVAMVAFGSAQKSIPFPPAIRLDLKFVSSGSKVMEASEITDEKKTIISNEFNV